MSIIEKPVKSTRLNYRIPKMKCGILSKKLLDTPLENEEFCSYMVAPPRRGKTSLIINFINNHNNFYWGVFNRIYLWTPNLHTVDEILKFDITKKQKDELKSKHKIHLYNAEMNELKQNNPDKIPEREIFLLNKKYANNLKQYQKELNTEIENIRNERVHQKLNVDDVMRIYRECVERVKENPKWQHLFIFDDVISRMTKRNMEAFLNMIYNRRHGHLSIFITSQKYNKLASDLRTVCSSLYLFKMNDKREYEAIYNELINIEEDKFKALCDYCFKDKHDFMYVKIEDGKFYRNWNELTFE
jgi:hypothetical protein